MAFEDTSILVDIKKALGLGADYTPFDPEIVMFINTAFTTLHQVGVGPKEVYRISGETEKWSAFTGPSVLEEVKTYIYMKVRLLFDPPTLSFVITMIENQITQLEWRMQVAHDDSYVPPKPTRPVLPEDEVDWADA